MGAPRYSEIGRTLKILDVEQVPSSWKLLASLSAWLLLAGYVMFPLAIDRQVPNPRRSRPALIALGAILLAIGYVACLIYCARVRPRHVLRDTIYMPCFGSSLIGLFNMVLNITVRGWRPLDGLSIAVVSLSTISAVAFGIAALDASNQTFFIMWRGKAGRHREEAINDTELQRRQLLRLYLKPDSDRGPSPEVSQSTFRIDLPEPGSLDGDDELVVTPPQHAYERRAPAPVSHYELVSMPDKTSSHQTSGSPRHQPTRSWVHHSQVREMRRNAAELGDL